MLSRTRGELAGVGLSDVEELSNVLVRVVEGFSQHERRALGRREAFEQYVDGELQCLAAFGAECGIGAGIDRFRTLWPVVRFVPGTRGLTHVDREARRRCHEERLWISNDAAVGRLPSSAPASTDTVQYAHDGSLVTSLPTVEQVLDDHVLELGHDFVAYRNHVYRVVNLCLAIAGDRNVEIEKIAVAAVFHDLGIWTNKTFDYIAPSVTIAREHLAARGLADWIPEIEAMIREHHKITPSRANPQSLVESFRRADWIDVSRGWRRFGLPRTFIATVGAKWPSAGFHRRLVELAIERLRQHPLTPLPMVKW